MTLNPEDLTVESFATVNLMASVPGECCTGCVSGCGYFPTNGGCESSEADNQI
jgi:hypothetical protein